MRKRWLVGLLLVLSLLGGSIASQAGPLSTLKVGYGGAEWAPQVEAEAFLLRIGLPDGTVTERSFSGGSRPFVRFGGGDGWADGMYVWELVAQFDPGRVGADSGVFWVLGGIGVPNGLAEGEQTGIRNVAQAIRSAVDQDQQVGDDLIVTGNACIGTSCVNGEPFSGSGLDTLWLKQPVVRLKFDDTSIDVGYPANDWQLTANDDGSGEANKFSIEDLTAATTPFTIFSGAPNNSLIVSSTGRVGIGTAVPARPLHIVTTGTPEVVEVQNNGPARFRFTNSATGEGWNFGHQSPSGTGLVFSDAGDSVSEMLLDVSGNLDLVGSLKLGGAWRLTPSASWFSLEDVTNARVPLKVAANASNDTLTVSTSGNVGIRTASPSGQLHLYGPANVDVFAGMGVDLANGPAFNYGYAGNSYGRSAGFFNIRPDASATAPNPSLRFSTANVQRIIIDNEGFIGIGTDVSAFNPTAPIHHTSGAVLTAGGSWQNGSSRSHKNSVRPLDDEAASTAFDRLVPVRFRYNEEPDDEYLGFIAEDVPELIASNGRATLSPMDLVALLTKVVQVQQTTIRQQDDRLRDLTARVEDLARRLNQDH